MGGGITDYHRQKRKKEQKKNKEKRLAERNARVLETKTVASVQDEIRQIERHHKVKQDEDGNDIPLPHAIKSKLDRLQKEVKLLREQDAAGPTAGPKPHKGKAAAAQQVWKPLDHPQLSIYYDAVMNPFGEPPPGQPRLYHTADGRTTFHLQEAALPGSRPPPPPPPPRGRPPPQQHNDRRPPPATSQRSKPTPSVSHKEGRHQSPPPAPPPLAPQPSSSSSRHSQIVQSKEPGPTTQSSTSTMPKAPPSLPSPSQAVKRGRSRLQADIWASTEEIAYHATTTTSSTVPLEGGTPTTQQPPITQWWYKDTHQQIQGPFPHAQMLAWVQAGFFPRDTLARPEEGTLWKPLHHYKLLRTALDKDQTTKEPSEVSLADRIAALKKEHQKTSVADRIAALRGEAATHSTGTTDDTPDDEPVENAAAATARPPPPVLDVMQEAMPAYSVPKQELPNDLPLPPPPPVATMPDMPAYTVTQTTASNVEVLPPPPPAGAGDVPMYPFREPSDMPGAYPIADETEPDLERGSKVPVTTTDDYDDDYPVTGVYESHGPSNDALSPVAKKVKVAKDVISFRPTHLVQKQKK